MRHNIPLLLLFLLGLFATACSSLTPPTLKSGLRVLLVPATSTGTPTPAALRVTEAILSERLAAFGFKNASVHELTSGSQPTLQVEVPHFGGDERGTLDTLLNTGMLEFWNTGPSLARVSSLEISLSSMLLPSPACSNTHRCPWSFTS